MQARAPINFAVLLSLGLALVACPKPQPGPTDGGRKTCKAEDCGPKPGMPNKMCDDGVTISGPGECVAKDGACGWEIIECPPPPEPTHCGGIAGTPCPAGMDCVDDPTDDCDPTQGGADCIGICQGPQACGSIVGRPCPEGMVCVDDPTDDCDPAKGGADCSGICHKACGGIAARPCPEDMICVDDPTDDCDPAKGGADCGGICDKAISCGGIAGRPCPEGMTCVDDPRDDCNPKKGGADCIGICQRQQPAQ